MSLTEGFLGLRLTKMGGRATSISFSPDASMANQRWQNDSFGQIMGQGTRQGSAATVLRWRLRNLVSLLTHHLAVGSDLRRAVPGKSAQQTFARFGQSRHLRHSGKSHRRSEDLALHRQPPMCPLRRLLRPTCRHLGVPALLGQYLGAGHAGSCTKVARDIATAIAWLAFIGLGARIIGHALAPLFCTYKGAACPSQKRRCWKRRPPGLQSCLNSDEAFGHIGVIWRRCHLLFGRAEGWFSKRKTGLFGASALIL
jgi:hypothetical protein